MTIDSDAMMEPVPPSVAAAQGTNLLIKNGLVDRHSEGGSDCRIVNAVVLTSPLKMAEHNIPPIGVINSHISTPDRQQCWLLVIVADQRVERVNST